MKLFEVGGYGPIRLKRGKFVWAKLKSPQMARRANELYYGPRIKRFLGAIGDPGANRWFKVTVKPRPYMQPALNKNLHVAEQCFRNVIK